MTILADILANKDILDVNAKKFAEDFKDAPWASHTSADILYQLFMQDRFNDMLEGILLKLPTDYEFTQEEDDIVFDALIQAFKDVGHTDAAEGLADIKENGL